MGLGLDLAQSSANHAYRILIAPALVRKCSTSVHIQGSGGMAELLSMLSGTIDIFWISDSYCIRSDSD